MSATKQYIQRQLANLYLLASDLNTIVVEYYESDLDTILAMGQELIRRYKERYNKIDPYFRVFGMRGLGYCESILIAIDNNRCIDFGGGVPTFADPRDSLRHVITVGFPNIDKSVLNLTDSIRTAWYEELEQETQLLVTRLLATTFLFAGTYVAIKFTRDELNFLLPLISKMKHAQATLEVVTENWSSSEFLMGTEYGSSMLLREADPADDTGGTLYIDATHKDEIADLRLVPQYKAAWEQFVFSSNYGECFKEYLAFLPSVIGLIIAGYLQSPGDELLEIHAQLRELEPHRWAPGKVGNLVTEHLIRNYPKVLMCISNREPLIMSNYDYKDRYPHEVFNANMLFCDPIKGLVPFVNGVVVFDQQVSATQQLGLLEYAVRTMSSLSLKGRGLAEQLITRTLVLAGTHVRIKANDLLHQNLKKHAPFKVDKMAIDGTWHQQEAFKKHLNTWLSRQTKEKVPLAVGLVTVEAGEWVFYVRVDAPRSLELLLSLTRPTVTQQPTVFTGGKVMAFFHSSQATATSPTPSALSTQNPHYGSYQIAIMGAIDCLRGYDPVTERLGALSFAGPALMPFAQLKYKFLTGLIQRYEARAATVIGKADGRDCLLALRAEIEKFRKEHSIILKKGLKGGARASDKLVAACNAIEVLLTHQFKPESQASMQMIGY